MSTPKHGYAAVAAADRLYVFGGALCSNIGSGVASVESLAVR